MSYKNETVPKRFKATAAKYSDKAVLLSKDESEEFQKLTFAESWRLINELGSGLLDLGIKQGEHIGIVSDNRKEWFIADMAIMGVGGADVPRGNDSTIDEIIYIMNHAECKVCFVENQTQLNKIIDKKQKFPILESLVVMDSNIVEEIPKALEFKVYTFKEILDRGKEALKKNPEAFESQVALGQSEDMATLIYTSGTTGEPKGVMLTHTSFLFQMDQIPNNHLIIEAGDVLLSVLPIWHSFERAVEYIVIMQGCSIAYSKPIGKILLQDMAKVNPMWFPSVPRIWESIRTSVYKKVKSGSKVKQGIFYFFVGVGGLYAHYYTQFKGWTPQFHKKFRLFDSILAFPLMIGLFPLKLLGDLLVFKTLKKVLGKRFKAGISGGGALPHYVDQFFRAVGIPVLEGYGLTETGPVLSVRKQLAPVPNTIGPVLPGVEYRIIGEDQSTLDYGHKGVLWVKTPQVMKGYYKKPEETEKVLKDGWLNTGDIALATKDGELAIRGRQKDTIVLMGGENIEPSPIEEKLTESDLIDTAVVLGQDEKFLAALIVPNFDSLEILGTEKKITFIEREELVDNPEIQETFHDVIQGQINPKTGFKPFERIFRFSLLSKEFEVGKELTLSLKVRRHEILKLYKKEIKALFH